MTDTIDNKIENKNNDYYVVVGMEVHCELNTKSKMWCSCINESLPEKPNKNICPICLAEPGTLPVPNKEAIISMIRIGMAVNIDSQDESKNIANYTEWDRKNYFYTDIPKGYQISQLKYPIVGGGVLADIPITRIHLEEDTAKSDHEKGAYTLVDFNRSGVPLMELVTDPVIYNSAQEAATGSANFCKELQRLLRTLKVSDADMERGEMRLEANISVTKDKSKFGTKCEVKNLNSFNSVEKAILYEVDRHIDMIARGEVIMQETRGWDENKQETFSQRKKENSADYRYFPDPDLPKLYLHDIFNLKELRDTLPLLPSQKRLIYSEIGLNEKQINTFIDNINISEYYDEGLNKLDNNEDKKIFANYLLTDAIGLLIKDSNLKLPLIDNFIKIVTMINNGELSSRGAKDILLDIMTKDNNPVDRANELGLIQNNDPVVINKIVEDVLLSETENWNKYTAGEDKLLMYFVGKCMKSSNGSGNPKIFTEKIIAKRNNK